MASSTTIDEIDWQDYIQPGKPLLGFVTVAKLKTPARADARMEVTWPDKGKAVFSIEAKTKYTSAVLVYAIEQSRISAKGGDLPMVIVPYLSPDAIQRFVRERVSAVDLCGNGVVTVPGKLFVQITGQPNLYPQSQPLNNPYRGSSAMVARMLLARPAWNTLDSLCTAINEAGAPLSLAQASKAITALQQDLMVAKEGRKIFRIASPAQMLDKLASAWRTPTFVSKRMLRVMNAREIPDRLMQIADLRWAYTGETSAPRYVTFGQGGSKNLAVTNRNAALKALTGLVEQEPLAGFAELTLVETAEPGYYFMNDVDSGNVRWAGKLQTYLEMQAGDARQKDAAANLRDQILREAANG